MMKWKILILFVTISTVAGLRSKFLSKNVEDIENLRTQQIIQKARLFQNKESNVEKFAKPAEEINFRLPNNTAPLHYDIHITSHIHTGSLQFEGVVRINFTVIETSNFITLQSRGHTITQITLFNNDGSEFDANPTHSYDNVTEFLTITTQELQASQNFVVEISYASILATFIDRGFFSVEYLDEDDSVAWLATTQFQPINARRAFPCYDEIRYRNTISLRISHHMSYNAISNMPVDGIGATDDYVTTVFQTTPVIPIFLLAFTVSRFDHISTTDDNIEFNVYGRPQAIEDGEADNALELAVIFLRQMEEYFDTVYALPKSDQIAVPQFSSDGANNWGLLSFHEDILLQVNDDAFAQHIREIRSAHEYSHIFFANLVSPVSWAYLWLNEGFATLYENVLNDIVFPEKNQWEQFLLDYLDVAISVDVFDFVDPLNRYVESPEEVRAKFDFITYFKGALVLRMFQEAFTEETWVKGVSNYLAEMEFESATPDDLTRGLNEALNEDNPGENLNATQLMDTWLNFGGFPVVTVSRGENEIVLTQLGFRTFHDELFSIPINYATASHPDFNDTRASYWLTGRELVVPHTEFVKTWNEGDWMIVNLRDTGYYLTNYEDDLWRLIIEALDNDHEAIHFLNRGTLFADLHRLIAENYDVRATTFLDLMRSLPLEHNSHVWVRANPGMLKFEERLRGSRLHRMHLNFVREIMASVYGRDFEYRSATLVVNQWSCLSGVQECLDDSLNALTESMDNPESSVTEFSELCNGFLSASETVWMHFFNEAMAAEPFTRETLLNALLCTRDSEILRFYYEQTLDFSNNLQNFEREGILINSAVQSDISFEAVINFVEENHADIEEFSSINNIVFELSRITNTECQAERVLYLTRFIPPGTNPGRQFFRSIMIQNLNFYDANFESFHDWFDNFEQISF